jgi:hypothetical protein
MNRLFLALLFILIAAAPSLAAEEALAVGRIFVIEPGKGFVIAQFAEGPRLIYIQRADVVRYKEGDEIRVDSFGRIRS